MLLVQCSDVCAGTRDWQMMRLSFSSNANLCQLKCLPNYSLSLTLRDWLSQNLPMKIWTQFKKSLLAMYFFSFLTFLFFVLPCSVWDSILAIRNALKSSKDLPCDSFIQKLCWSTYHVIPCNVHKERSIFSVKADCPPPSLHTPPPPTSKPTWYLDFLCLLAVPIHYSRVLLAPKTFFISLFQDRAGLASSAMNTVLQLATVCCCW